MATCRARAATILFAPNTASINAEHPRHISPGSGAAGARRRSPSQGPRTRRAHRKPTPAGELSSSWARAAQAPAARNLLDDRLQGPHDVIQAHVYSSIVLTGRVRDL